MKFYDTLKILGYLIEARLRHSRYPLAIRWNITDKCHLKCLYCNIGNLSATAEESNELETAEILLMINQIAEAGVMRISFSGGEPMMRDDIGKIIAYSKDKGIGVELNSSGKFVPARSGEIGGLSLLKLSLDGPECIHEIVKIGSKYKEVTEAADACVRQKIRFSFCATITKYNVRHLKSILDIARFYHTFVAFQPVQYLAEASDNVQDYYPSVEEFRSAVRMLIDEKKKGSRHIRNSTPGLRYIYNWPEYNKLRCWAGEVFCVIGSDGTIYPCDRISYSTKLPNCLRDGFKIAYHKLPAVKECKGCGFCGTLELNYLMSFNFAGTDPIRRYL